MIAIVGGGLWYLWSRGGQQEQVRVEKLISSDRFAQ